MAHCCHHIYIDATTVIVISGLNTFKNYKINTNISKKCHGTVRFQMVMSLSIDKICNIVLNDSI